MLTTKKKWNNIKTTLNQQIITALNQLNYQYMMPVQEAAIPLLLKNYDIAVEAQTGSGKTLAFVIPLIQKLLDIDLQRIKQKANCYVKFVILAPTRQLCQQTFSLIERMLKAMGSNIQEYLSYCYCTTGGKPLSEDIQKVKDNALVIVSTVGRLKQLANSFSADWLKKVDYLYIDEADRVLKQKGIQQLIKYFQKMRRTAMFSATLTGLQPSHYQFYGMRNLAKISLKPLSQDINHSKNYVVPKTLTNNYISFGNRLQKIYFLFKYLEKFHVSHLSKLIIFFNTCASVDFYSKLISAYLSRCTYDTTVSIIGVHGKLKPNRRRRLLNGFMKAKKSCLLATDVVARGIDFDRIDMIIQVDPPEDPDNYVHRIGRTARIDRPGTAILLLEDHENTFINYLQNKSVDVKLTTADQYKTSQLDNQEIKQKILQIIMTDRDFIQKSKKAFVSYIRSYMQHDLKYIFEFKHMNVGFTAQSFFLLRIPRIKQILGKKIENFQQSSINIDGIPWVDKNQQLQYLRKRQKLEEQKKKQQQLKSRTKPKQDIKNKKSQRKRQKLKMQKMGLKQLNRDHNMIKKERRNKGMKKMQEEQSDQSDCDTEQLQRRIMLRND